MKKIYIGTPAYSGKVNALYALSLVQTAAYLASKNIPSYLSIPTGSSLITAERNRLISDFLKSDCTHMLCIDADMAWKPEDVEKLLNYEKDFVGACYPARLEKKFIFRPCVKEDDSLITDGKALIKMNYIPAGFILLSKKLISTMSVVHAKDYYKPKDEKQPDGYALFNTEVYEEEFWGEDFVFCRKAREAGFDIWVDPLILLNHDGNVGCLAEVISPDRPDKLDPKKEV